jgi:hypothetical protein
MIQELLWNKCQGILKGKTRDIPKEMEQGAAQAKLAKQRRVVSFDGPKEPSQVIELDKSRQNKDLSKGNGNSSCLCLKHEFPHNYAIPERLPGLGFGKDRPWRNSETGTRQGLTTHRQLQ